METPSLDALPPSSPRWTARVFGRFDVASPAGERPKFRSKSAQALLAYLVLHPGKDVSRFVLEEILWPCSDGSKQAQNLRAAIAHLRKILEQDGPHGSVIETRRDVVSANATSIVSEAAHFHMLCAAGLRDQLEDPLYEAVALYGGSLLEPLHDEWIYAYRLEFEELYGQCVSTLCGLRVAAGAPKDAVRIARSAILLAPTREDIHVALILAYRRAGMEAEAIRQYEDLERMMDETWGELPSSEAREALEGRSVEPVRPRLATPEPERAGGAMALTSSFYIRRAADVEVERCLDGRESVILIQGPRQVGKSSLLARALAFAVDQGMATAQIDIQSIGESQLADEERLYKGLVHSLARQLRVEIDVAATWQDWLGSNMNFDEIMGQLLSQADGHVCWAIDEVDRLFGRPYANDFFGLLRSWHNRRALDPQGPWGKLTLALAYATEAHLFITDLSQSPFNVGVRLPLRDFSRAEVRELAECYAISDEEAIEAAFATTNGHPFLARRALAFLSQGRTARDLEATCTLPDGPFGDHLHGVLGTILHDEELVKEVRRLQAGEPFSKPTTRFRLMAAGILTMTSSSSDQFRVPGYGPCLVAALG